MSVEGLSKPLLGEYSGREMKSTVCCEVVMGTDTCRQGREPEIKTPAAGGSWPPSIREQ